MRAEKDPKTGKWLIQYRYTDWQGKRRKSTKRGFKTKREAEEWLRNFLMTQTSDFDMKFAAVFLLSLGLFFSTLQGMHAFDGKSAEGTGRTAVAIDKKIASEYEGILTDEKVQQMMSEFKITQDLHGLNAKYIYINALQSAAFSHFSDMDGKWNGLSVADVYGDKEINIGLKKVWVRLIAIN